MEVAMILESSNAHRNVNKTATLAGLTHWTESQINTQCTGIEIWLYNGQNDSSQSQVASILAFNVRTLQGSTVNSPNFFSPNFFSPQI